MSEEMFSWYCHGLPLREFNTQYLNTFTHPTQKTMRGRGEDRAAFLIQLFLLHISGRYLWKVFLNEESAHSLLLEDILKLTKTCERPWQEAV